MREEDVTIKDSAIKDSAIKGSPTEDLPTEDSLIENLTAEEFPTEDSPIENSPIENVPIENVPIENVQIEDVQIEDLPIEDVPIENGPIEDFPMEELPAILEALLFVNGDAIALEDIAKALAISPMVLQGAADMLASRYETMPGGLSLQRFGDKVQLSTKKAYHEYIERVFAPKQLQTLSTSMLETLAIIAYKQPVTRLEIEEIRGVKCDYSVSALLHRGMIESRGRKDTLGRPMLYGTTDAFLRTFELSSLNELPNAEQLLSGHGITEEQEEMTI